MKQLSYSSVSEKQIAQSKQTSKQMGRRPNQTFLQRHTDGQQAHEKMLNIAKHLNIIVL